MAVPGFLLECTVTDKPERKAKIIYVIWVKSRKHQHEFILSFILIQMEIDIDKDTNIY